MVVVCRIQVTYGELEAPYQGGSGGSASEVKLHPEERITAVTGYFDNT